MNRDPDGRFAVNRNSRAVTVNSQYVHDYRRVRVDRVNDDHYLRRVDNLCFLGVGLRCNLAFS